MCFLTRRSLRTQDRLARGSIGALKANLITALAADTTIRAGKIVFINSGQLAAIPPTPLAGSLTLVYTSGPAILTICTVIPSAIGTSGITTFVFNALLGIFIRVGFVQGIPFEAIVELCNRVGANCWYNWPIYTKGSYITACTNFIASNTTGLTSGLKFGAEVGNEMWNFSAAPWGRAQCYGIALGLFSFPYGGDQGPYSWQGLRTVQYANLSIAAWGATRAASQHYILTPTAEFDAGVGSNFDLYCLKGQFLVTSNSNYANFSGLGGTANAISHTAAGSRPADISTALGVAPYWGSPWFAGAANIPGGFGVVGTVAQNTPMLQAAFDYASGSTATAFGELTNQFNGTTTRSGGASGGITLNPNYTSVFASQEAQAAQFDAFRIGAGMPKLGILHYEGGPQWAAGASAINGVNSSSSLASALLGADVTALANQITALGWNVSAFTVSTTNNATEMATQILEMGQGWKYDTDVNGTTVNSGSYKNLIKTSYYQALATASSGNREVHGCQYGYNASQWGLWWNNYNSAGASYQNYSAIAEFNT